MQGKSVAITGANSGIGWATAKTLAQKGAHILLICRNASKAKVAAAKLKQLYPRQNFEIALCDLSDLESVKSCAENLSKKNLTLDVLINNAGLALDRHTLNQQGFEQTFVANYLGPFLLTLWLLPLLAKSSNARIIHVSSKLHIAKKIPWEQIPQFSVDYKMLNAYGQSKLMNILFSNELARRLKNQDETQGITSNSLHPGGVATNIASSVKNPLLKLGAALISFFLLSPEEGAETSIDLASNPAWATTSGCYFVKKKIEKPYRVAEDTETALRLWKLSLDLCKRYLPPDDHYQKINFAL